MREADRSGGQLCAGGSAAAARSSGSWATDSAARASMVANRSRDTGPEMAIRRRLHAAGLRYRVDFPPLAAERRRRADIVFTRLRIAIFIDGCFWHGCPAHFSAPRANADYWGPKIARNIERDGETNAALIRAGWRVMRFWEHQPATEVAAEIIAAVRLASSATSSAD
ncbi:MAG: very short patch repair endonuclease [Patulibacter sp.]